MPERQIVRQLKILQTLEANRFGKSARELAAKYEVNRKTIQRDMWDLREAGFWITGPPDDPTTIYYQLEKDTGLPLNFPIMEVAAMIFAERAGMGLIGAPFGEHLQSAHHRLTQAMPPKNAAIPRNEPRRPYVATSPGDTSLMRPPAKCSTICTRPYRNAAYAG